MGTETNVHDNCILSYLTQVKLNNPLMGTETYDDILSSLNEKYYIC